jgi:hypothetical protein
MEGLIYLPFLLNFGIRQPFFVDSIYKETWSSLIATKKDLGKSGNVFSTFLNMSFLKEIKRDRNRSKQAEFNRNSLIRRREKIQTRILLCHKNEYP